MGLKSKFPYSSLSFCIKVLKILVVERYYHFVRRFGCKDSNNYNNSQKIELIFTFFLQA